MATIATGVIPVAMGWLTQIESSSSLAGSTALRPKLKRQVMPGYRCSRQEDGESMNRILDRISAADGVVSRLAGWSAEQVLPPVTAEAASCSWRCTGVACIRIRYDFNVECMWCGHWTGNCRCAYRCR